MNIPISINETQLSDLFFNHHKPFLSEVYQGLEDTGLKIDEKVQTLIDRALLEEAKSFSKLLGGQVTPEYLVSDYKARL